ncbi:synapse-associated protein 1 isoform X2 [Chelonia mydas]|uniref:synapse-associated protein 1 isoform X2 n=1 Tax=Chelonia mydas TaxID=8469 RepID=UPI001CA86A76|nr:synapse-associated protein 1 isoform X2 [Chelonia mydas]
MLRGLGSWFGLERAGEEQKPPPEESSSPGERSEAGGAEGEAAAGGDPAVRSQEQVDPDPLLSQAKGLGNYLFNFATAATKKISESVAETAQNIKKSVEEGKIDTIIDKTIIGDFQKEQEKFVQEKHTKKSEAAVPPWVDSNEEETIQQQILALSADRRNFLRDPPAGVQFNFDFDQMYPIAMVMLQEDELLNRMRFDLVPKHVKEEVFWRNYFYRVSLIKQSAQLTALAAQQQVVGKEENNGRKEDIQLTAGENVSTWPLSTLSQRLVQIRRQKKQTRDYMFAELVQSSHTDRAQLNVWRQTIVESRKASHEYEERRDACDAVVKLWGSKLTCFTVWWI